MINATDSTDSLISGRIETLNKELRLMSGTKLALEYDQHGTIYLKNTATNRKAWLVNGSARGVDCDAALDVISRFITAIPIVR